MAQENIQSKQNNIERSISNSVTMRYGILTSKSDNKTNKILKGFFAKLFGSSNQSNESSKRNSNSSRRRSVTQLNFEFGLPLSRIRQCLAVFDKYDLDKNGALSKDELKATLIRLGITNPTKKELQHIMKTFDTNGDDEIDVMEFLDMIKHMDDMNMKPKVSINAMDDNVLCSFIALGGNADRSGAFKVSKVQSIVEVFELKKLKLDAQALQSIANETIDYVTFSALFPSVQEHRT